MAKGADQFVFKTAKTKTDIEGIKIETKPQNWQK